MPREVSAAIERADLCMHFAGEINGDGSDRDKEVYEALRRYRCESIAATIGKLKRKYRKNPLVSQRLVAAGNALNQ